MVDSLFWGGTKAVPGVGNFLTKVCADTGGG